MIIYGGFKFLCIFHSGKDVFPKPSYVYIVWWRQVIKYELHRKTFYLIFD